MSALKVHIHWAMTLDDYRAIISHAIVLPVKLVSISIAAASVDSPHNKRFIEIYQRKLFEKSPRARILKDARGPSSSAVRFLVFVRDIN